ncbi:MAG: Fe-S cluster assembly protein NifU [Candidatus Brocadiia bacterium]
MWDYSDKVKRHFLSPSNVGEIKDANGVGEVGSIACGDALRLTIKVEDGKIVDAKFQTFGCGSAIASASVLTEMIIGHTIEEASKITNQDIVDFLGGLPAQKMHCSVMGAEALQAAIANYLGKSPDEIKKEAGEVICHCFGVTDKTIEKVIRQHRLREVDDVTNFTKAGGACGSCKPQIEAILNRVWSDLASAPLKKPQTYLEKVRTIERVIEEEIRPLLNHDGGDIELIDVVGNVVKVKLLKNCASCPVSPFTLNDFVGKKLREFVDESIVIEEVVDER